MNGDDTVRMIGIITMLVLVASSLVSRRVRPVQTLKMVGGWLLIFVVVLIGYSYRFELRSVLRRVSGDVLGEQGPTEGGTLRVPISPDGHFWVRAKVNGATVRFLIDSGATFTALAASSAQSAGISLSISEQPIIIETANGSVQAQRGRIARLEVGSMIATDLPVVVSPAFGEINVLGMNFLSDLKSWKVERGTLVLEPDQTN